MYTEFEMSADLQMLGNTGIPADLAPESLRTLSVTNTTSSSKLEYTTNITLKGHWSAVRSVSWLAGRFDGLICSASTDKTMRVWLKRSRECIAYQSEVIIRGHSLAVSCVLQLRDDRICTSSLDGLIKIWDPDKNWTDGQCDKTMRGHSKGVNVIILLSGRNQLCSGSEDSTLMIWSLSTYKSMQVLKGHDGPVLAVIELRSGKLCSTSADHTMIIWTKEKLTADAGANTSGGYANNVASNRINLNAISRSSVVAVPAVAAQSSPGGNASPVTAPTRKTLAASNNLLITASKKYSTAALDIEQEYRMENSLLTRGHKGAVNCVVELPDGRLCSCSTDSTLKLWDPVNYVCVKTLEGHWTAVNWLALLADGRICSCSDDRTIRFWDADRFEKKNMSTPDDHCLRTIHAAHDDAIYRVIQLPSGQLCSCSEDNTIKIWT